MAVDNNFQRVGAVSSMHVGREFEEAARLFFAKTGKAIADKSHDTASESEFDRNTGVPSETRWCRELIRKGPEPTTFGL